MRLPAQARLIFGVGERDRDQFCPAGSAALPGPAAGPRGATDNASAVVSDGVSRGAAGFRWPGGIDAAGSLPNRRRVGMDCRLAERIPNAGDLQRAGDAEGATGPQPVWGLRAYPESSAAHLPGQESCAPRLGEPESEVSSNRSRDVRNSRRVNAECGMPKHGPFMGPMPARSGRGIWRSATNGITPIDEQTSCLSGYKEQNVVVRFLLERRGAVSLSEARRPQGRLGQAGFRWPTGTRGSEPGNWSRRTIAASKFSFQPEAEIEIHAEHQQRG